MATSLLFATGLAAPGLAQQAGAEAAFCARGLLLESAALEFPRFATEGSTVINF